MTNTIDDEKLTALVNSVKDRVTEGALQGGWSEKEALTMGAKAIEPFMSALMKGYTPQAAMVTSIFTADRYVCGVRMDTAVKNGVSPEEAFAEIQAIKLKANPSHEGQAMADAAKAAFDASLAEGRDSQLSLNAAFAAARALQAESYSAM